MFVIVLPHFSHDSYHFVLRGVLLHMLVVGHEPFDMDSMDLHRDIEEERLRFLEYGSDGKCLNHA